eukprot:10700742-Alexandrium_andersonii.AAC.1
MPDRLRLSKYSGLRAAICRQCWTSGVVEVLRYALFWGCPGIVVWGVLYVDCLSTADTVIPRRCWTSGAVKV